MSYPSRSTDRPGPKRRRTSGTNYFDYRKTSAQAGNPSPHDQRSDPRAYSPPPYDRRARSPPRGPSYHPDTAVDRYTSDRGDRPIERRFTRDRSSSPARNNRGGRKASVQWDDTNRDKFVEKVSTGETYRPKYPDPVANSSPAPSPTRPHLVTDNPRDSRTSSAILSPPPNQPNNKSDSAISSRVSSPHPNQPAKAKDSKIVDAVLGPHPKEPSDDREPGNDEDSIPRPKLPNPKAPITDLKSTNVPRQKPATMAVPPPQLQKDATDAVKDLGQLLYQLIEEATDLASLKNQKDAAERDFGRRENEYNKSKPNHEKFPATEEALRKSKDQAKKALQTISQKCEKKDAALKSIALRGATRLLPGTMSGNTQAQDELQRRCQDLEDQLREQKSFIENQRSEREALQTDFWKIQEELTATKNSYEQFHTGIRPLVAQAVQSASKATSDLGTLKLDIKRDISALSNSIPQDLIRQNDVDTLKSDMEKELSELSKRIPQNLSVRLNDMTTRLNNSLEAVKENSADTTAAKAIADNARVIGDYGPRLQKLESQVCGQDNKGGVISHVKTIVETQSKFREALDTVASQVGIAASRLDKLPSNEELADFRKRIAVVESDLKKKIVPVDKHHHPNRPAAPAGSLNGGEQLAGLEKRLSTLESVQSTASNTPAPELSIESMKEEMLAIIESREAAFDTVIGENIDKLKKAVTKIEEDIKKQTNTYAPLSSLSNLQTKLDEVSRSIQHEQAYGEVLNQIDIKYNNWTSDQHGSQQILSDRIETIAKGHQYLDDRVEAVTMGINQVNSRLNGMNTRDMAVHILSQMDSTYPNLRDAQNTLVEHRTSLQRAETQFLEQDRTINALSGQIKALEGHIKQNPTKDPKTTQELRKDVDDLNTHMTTARKVAKEAKDAIEAAAKKSQREAQVLADQFADVYVQLGKLEDQQKALSLSKVSPAKSAMPGSGTSSPAVETRAPSLANGNSSIRRTPQLQKSPASRQSSGEPLTKKRRPNGVGGLGGAALPPPKSNGMHGSLGRKKRKINIEGEDSDDYDFEPPPPTIDDDDDD